MSSHGDRKSVSADLGYDRSEPSVGKIVITTIAILLILIVTGAGVEFYYHAYKDRVIQEVQLEPVSQELVDLRKKEDQLLGTYGISDKATGAVRLPVSRAMELVIADAKEGKLKYSTAPYEVKKVEEVEAPAAGTTPEGAAAPAPNQPAH